MCIQTISVLYPNKFHMYICFFIYIYVSEHMVNNIVHAIYFMLFPHFPSSVCSRMLFSKDIIEFPNNMNQESLDA